VSKNETPMTRWYWQQVGGLLIEEFTMVKASLTNAPRYLDGLIVLGEPTAIAESRSFDIAGRDVIAIQAKAKRLGMMLMGQCLFSRELLLAMSPRSVRSVALCRADDSVLRPLLEAHKGCEVAIYDPPPVS
jgi:hypothetical protein